MSLLDRLRWYRHRLQAMRPAEVGHRVAERLRHSGDGRFFRKASNLRITSAEPVPRLPEPASAPPDLLRQLASDAAAILEGDWQLFGWKHVSVGAPPCWHRDPLTGVVIDPAPLAHRR